MNGEKVGEAEFTRMQTRDLLKQQVKAVSQVVPEKGQPLPSSKLNKLAKQVLRVLASCSLMSLEGGSAATEVGCMLAQFSSSQIPGRLTLQSCVTKSNRVSKPPMQPPQPPKRTRWRELPKEKSNTQSSQASALQDPQASQPLP